MHIIFPPCRTEEKTRHFKVYRIFFSRMLTPPFNTHPQKSTTGARSRASLDSDAYRRCAPCYRFKSGTRRNHFEEIVCTRRVACFFIENYKQLGGVQKGRSRSRGIGRGRSSARLPQIKRTLITVMPAGYRREKGNEREEKKNKR